MQVHVQFLLSMHLYNLAEIKIDKKIGKCWFLYVEAEMGKKNKNKNKHVDISENCKISHV